MIRSVCEIILDHSQNYWYVRNRKKFWVVLFLTIGFIIGFPFVIFGVICEIRYQMEKSRHVDPTEDIDLDIPEIIENKYEIRYECQKCPNCGSGQVETYTIPPSSTIECLCKDCENTWKAKKKINIIIDKYVCPNCGSYNVKPHIGGITGVYICIDCNYIGLPIVD